MDTKSQWYRVHLDKQENFYIIALLWYRKIDRLSNLNQGSLIRNQITYQPTGSTGRYAPILEHIRPELIEKRKQGKGRTEEGERGGGEKEEEEGGGCREAGGGRQKARIPPHYGLRCFKIGTITHVLTEQIFCQLHSKKFALLKQGQSPLFWNNGGRGGDSNPPAAIASLPLLPFLYLSSPPLSLPLFPPPSLCFH